MAYTLILESWDIFSYRCFRDRGVMEFCIQSDNRKFWSRLLVGKTVLHSTETTFDAGLVALESISPRKGTYYDTLRCRTLSSKENLPRQWPAPCFFLRQIGLSPRRVPYFPSHQGAWPELPVISLNMIRILSKFHHTSIPYKQCHDFNNNRICWTPYLVFVIKQCFELLYYILQAWTPLVCFLFT